MVHMILTDRTRTIDCTTSALSGPDMCSRVRRLTKPRLFDLQGGRQIQDTGLETWLLASFSR
jgi:hypothetical protein